MLPLTRKAAQEVMNETVPAVANLFQKAGLSKQASAVFNDTLNELEVSCGEFPNRDAMFEMIERANIRDPHYFKQNLRRIRDLIPGYISEQLALHQQVRNLRNNKDFNPEVLTRIEELFAKPYLLSSRELKPYPHGIAGVLAEHNTFVECNLSTLRTNVSTLKGKYGKRVTAYVQTLGLYDFQTEAACRELAASGCLLVTNSRATVNLIGDKVPEASIMITRNPLTEIEPILEKNPNVTIGCESVAFLNAADSAGKTLKTQVKVQLEVAYNAMSAGIPFDQIEDVTTNLKETHPNVILEGIYCHPNPHEAAQIAHDFVGIVERIKQTVDNSATFQAGISNAGGVLTTLPAPITHVFAGRQVWGIHNESGIVNTNEVGAPTVVSVRSKCVTSKKTGTTNKEVMPAGPGMPRIYMGSREGLAGPESTKWGITNRLTKEMIVDGTVTTVSVGPDYSWVTDRAIRPNPLLPVTIHGTAGTGKSVFLSVNELSNIPRHIPRTLYDPDAWKTDTDALTMHLEGLISDRSELVEVLLQDLIETEQDGLLWFYAEPSWHVTTPYRPHINVPRLIRQKEDQRFNPNDSMMNHRFIFSDMQEKQAYAE